MGYSATSEAFKALEEVTKFCVENTGELNTWKHNDRYFFYEVGRENADGAITGSIVEMTPKQTVRGKSSFRIEPNGDVTRFPYLPKYLRKHFAAEKRTRAAFAEGAMFYSE